MARSFFMCAAEHVIEIHGKAEEGTESWRVCESCGMVAEKVDEADTGSKRRKKTHWDQVRSRRTVEELNELLTEAKERFKLSQEPA